VDRGRGPLDLQEGPDRGLVHDDLDVAPVVRLPILLVPEDLPVAQRGEDGVEGVGIRDLELDLGPALHAVVTLLPGTLVGQDGATACPAQAQGRPPAYSEERASS
jgi:hypothetical protein